MKNVAIILMTFAVGLFSCQDLDIAQTPHPDPTPGGPDDYPPNIDDPDTAPTLASTNFTQFNVAVKQSGRSSYSRITEYLGSTNDLIVVNYDKMFRDNSIDLSNRFQMPSTNISLPEAFYLNPNVPGEVVPSDFIEAYDFITPGQMTHLDNYIRNMYDAIGKTSANIHYTNEKNKIKYNSSLSEEEKIGVTALIEAANDFAQQYFSGETDVVGTTIFEAYQTSNSGGCQVNWRGVWASAVVGGVANGVRGAMIGAAGGTMTIPGVGTAAGAVGGGIFGFATGFFGGAVSGIAANLLTTCFRMEVDANTRLISEFIGNQGGDFDHNLHEFAMNDKIFLYQPE